MKRALKKRVKAVLNNNPNSDTAPVEQLNETNHKANRRARTQAAMIGLAISMGATSLLVTRQSDQAQAAAPVGSQKAASTIPAVSDTDIKFAATKLKSQAVSSARLPENPVILEPTAVSQVPGLEAKWPITVNEMAVQIPTSEAEKNAIYLQSQVDQRLKTNSVQSRLQTANQLPEIRVQQLSSSQGVAGSQPTKVIIVESPNTVSNDVDAQLKAQQEFALNRLQEKSNRLKNSLAELRSDETQKLTRTRKIEIAQPTTITDKTVPAQLEEATDSSQASLISRLKEEKQTSGGIQKVTSSAPAVPKVVAQSLPKVVAQSFGTTYEVRPGDTLAEIASNYGISVSELVKANNLADPNQLQISQQLIIPTARAERSSYDQSTVAVQRTFVQSNNIATVASSPVNKLDLDANLPQVSQPSGVRNTNTAVISIPAVKENQFQVNTPTATTNGVSIPVPVAHNNELQSGENDLSSPIAYGVGGETPSRDRVTKIPMAQKQRQKVAKVKGNERLRSLQAEIERLREKYRPKESGVTVQTTSASDDATAPVVIETGNHFAPSRVNSQRNAVAIPLPTPILPSYREQPVKPQLRAARPMNEPINPEFLLNQTTSSGNFDRNNSSGIKLVVPSAGVNSTDSLGKLRGTRVSPALPPLAAVDLYLPKNVDQNSNPQSTSSASYIWPAKGVLTSGYGWRWGRMHRGIDIANGVGTPIHASAPGVVERAGWNNGGYGNVVDIRHTDGSMTRYGHNSRILVQVGQQVEQGQTIAAMGSTGFSTGPHSHFEVHPAGKGAVNPIAFLPSQARL